MTRSREPSGAVSSAAFARGSLDGWIIWDSYFARAQKEAGARVLMDGRALPSTSSFYVASRDFAEGSPGRLRAVLDRFHVEPSLVRQLTARGLDPRAEPSPTLATSA